MIKDPSGQYMLTVAVVTHDKGPFRAIGYMIKDPSGL